MSRSYFIQNILYIDPIKKIESKMDLLIQDGKVHLNAKKPASGTDLKTIPAQSLLAFPGFIDVGTRTGEPGLERKETLESVSRAALSAGYSTLIHSPITKPVVDTPYLVHYLKEKTRALDLCEFYSLANISNGALGKELAEIGLLSEAGVVGFYDGDKTIMNTYLFKKALEYLKKFKKPLLSYCEDSFLSHKTALHEGMYSNILGLRGSPSVAEEIIVARDIALCRLTKTPIHFIKISTKNAVTLIKNAKDEGLPITASTSIAHLFLNEENLKNYDTNLKTNPPLRTQEDQHTLQEAILDGTLDFIISDHNPQGVLEKITEFDLAEPGMSSIEYTPSLFIEWAQKKGLSNIKISEILFLNPARIFLKEALEKHFFEGNLTLFAPNEKWILKKESMLSKSKNTYFLNHSLQGKTLMTFIKGQLKYEK